MKQKLSARRNACKSPLRASWTIRGLNLGALQPGQALAILRKSSFRIGFEPKRLGSLASPASAFALEGESGREVLVYRATRNRCANNVSTYESTSKPIGTFFCQVTPSNILLLCDNGRARAGSSVANKRQVLHTAGEDFPCNKKTAGSRNVAIELLYLGSRLSDGKISFASSSRELLERCDVVG